MTVTKCDICGKEHRQEDYETKTYNSYSFYKINIELGGDYSG